MEPVEITEEQEVKQDEEQETVQETEVSEETGREPEAVKYSKAVQKRINEIVYKKNEALKKVQELEAQLENKNAGRPIRPSIARYTNEYGEINQQSYDSALSDYEDKLFDWKQKDARDREFAERAKIRNEAQKEKFLVLADEMRQTHPDFDEVIERPIYSQQLSQALFEIDKGAEIAYYLGNHSDEALRIGQLPPVSMVKELNELLKNKLKKSISNAPAPIDPITGIKSGKQKKWDEMSDEEWYRMRERERFKGG